MPGNRNLAWLLHPTTLSVWFSIQLLSAHFNPQSTIKKKGQNIFAAIFTQLALRTSCKRSTITMSSFLDTITDRITETHFKPNSKYICKICSE